MKNSLTILASLMVIPTIIGCKTKDLRPKQPGYHETVGNFYTGNFASMTSLKEDPKILDLIQISEKRTNCRIWMVPNKNGDFLFEIHSYNRDGKHTFTTFVLSSDFEIMRVNKLDDDESKMLRSAIQKMLNHRKFKDIEGYLLYRKLKGIAFK